MSHVRPRHFALLVMLVACAFVSVPAAASADVTPLAANLEQGDMSEFSQWHDMFGSLTTDSTRAYEGTRSARAHYPGGTDNAYQRGIWNVDWNDGEDVWYSSAFYLPVGFKANMRGQVDIMRWDNWVSHPNDTDWGGLVIYNGDKKMRLMRFNMEGDGAELVGPMEIPEGRWVHLEVHQRLSDGAGALSEVYMDGRLLGRSTTPNTYGRPIQRIRTGIVAIGAGSQTQPLTLWFDRARVNTVRQGPGTDVADVAAAPPVARRTAKPARKRAALKRRARVNYSRRCRSTLDGRALRAARGSAKRLPASCRRRF